MKLSLKWLAVITGVFVLLAIFFITPTLTDDIPRWWRDHLFSDKIHLGLDLKGGMHLVLEVQCEVAVKSSLERTADNLKRLLGKEGVEFDLLKRSKENYINISLSSEDYAKLEDFLNNNFPQLRSVEVFEEEGKTTTHLSFIPREERRIKEFSVDQAVETIRGRVDQFGVAEPSIQRQGERRILIQLPGIKDPNRAIRLIKKAALLEFKLVDDGGMTLKELREAIKNAKEETPDIGDDIVTLNEALNGIIPEDHQVLYEVRRDPQTRRTTKTPFLLMDEARLTGEFLKDARVSYGQFNEPYISIEFNSQGSKIFEKLTGDNVDRRLAIVLDNIIHSAPVIREKISGGRAQITGHFTTEEAHDLAVVLRAGSLPAPVKILERRTVGPSLGRDSIEKGMLSMIVGGILVVVFMISYYRLSGAIADTALALNILFILSCLAAFKATLTLPGIAGVVLTIGMAVDANVIIFERIREELKVGKTPRSAIEGGYSKALLTILDANITTLIAALILFQYGTGPIRGFAVTLSIGIVSSLFTALIVTRIIQEYLIGVRGVKKLSI